MTAAPKNPNTEMGGGIDESHLGLVTDAVAGGNGSTCNLCGEPDGYHTGQCPVVSHHGGDS